jgi:hypothetical protein
VELNFAFELFGLGASEAPGQFDEDSTTNIWLRCTEGVARKHFDCVLLLTILGGTLFHSINLTEPSIIIIHEMELILMQNALEEDLIQFENLSVDECIE